MGERATGGNLSQTLTPYHLQHPSDIFDYLVIPEPQYRKTVLAQALVPAPVALPAQRVLAAVKLDDQLGGKRDEIHDVIFDGLLAAELHPFNLTVPEMPPQQALHIRRVVAQLPGKGGESMSRFHGKVRTLSFFAYTHPLTPSRQGRGNLLPSL